MRLLIKQRVFSWTDTYDVYDEQENPKYFVKSKMFSMGHEIHVSDIRTNQEIGVIQQIPFSFIPKFQIWVQGNLIGTIRKKFSFFHPQYQVDFNGWRVEGDFWGWDYNVLDESRHIMSISKELFYWGDTYVLEFDSPQDEFMGLLLVIAIDAANCQNR